MKKSQLQFDAYEVNGVIERDGCCEQVDDAKAEFWSLYGHIPGQGLECIGDFSTREFAEGVYSLITGLPPETLGDVLVKSHRISMKCARGEGFCKLHQGRCEKHYHLCPDGHCTCKPCWAPRKPKKKKCKKTGTH